MNTSRSLPVIVPKVADQRWSCHSCGDCCRTLVVRLTDDERERIDRQGWAEKLGIAPYVRVGRGWQASLRFDCPSVISSKGKPISQHRSWLGELASALPRTSSGSATRFRKGEGFVPQLPGLTGEVTFDTVESVEPVPDCQRDVENLLFRYLTTRLAGHSVFVAGYYGRPVFSGLAALWLSVAAAGWLARYSAAADGRTQLSFQDAGRALGIVDRAATRLPVLSTTSERVRGSFLLRDDGTARLLHNYSLLTTTQ